MGKMSGVNILPLENVVQGSVVAKNREIQGL